MSPSNKKGGSGLTRNPPNVSVTTKTDIHQQPNRKTGARHADGQTSLPIVPALAFPPAPGLKRAVLLVEHCPACGWWHRHQTQWPTAKLLFKRGKCGQGYQLIPYARRARKQAA